MTASGAPVGRLTVCPTPIGNLADITLRALEELAAADVIACEDTRRTRVLLDRNGIVGPTLVSLHEHNEDSRARELAERIGAGARVALVSDAGMPLISDPGHALLRECLRAELPVEVLPGASASVTALVASGLPGARWCFAGFLPRKRGELRALLAGADQTVVAYESPRRLAATLALLAEIDPQRPAAVCRELTKLHEEVARGSAEQLAERFGAREVRGEVTLVVGAAEAGEGASREEALAALRELVAAGARPRPAAAALAKLTGLGANELYRGLTGPAE
jgi:16S rRNA (cytidine1402-2'-O)-methyltransferase